MDDITLYIPTIEEMSAAVLSSPLRGERGAGEGERTLSTPAKDVKPECRLSLEAYAFLHHAALPEHCGCSLEQHWAGIGVSSGSVKRRILHELMGEGLIALEKKGKAQMVRFYPEAWDVLGVSPPKGLGTGGSLHKALVNRLAREFRARGYDVHVEFPVGRERKRVDLVALGSARLGVEVGLTDPIHEIRNIRSDLSSGALDYIIFCSNNISILDRVREGANTDSWLLARLHRIQFYFMEE